jgi:hypothetical protein
MEDLTSALEEHGIDGVVKPEYFAGIHPPPPYITYHTHILSYSAH